MLDLHKSLVICKTSVNTINNSLFVQIWHSRLFRNRENLYHT